MSEFVSFLAHNKKYWLLPVVVVLAAVGGILVFGTTAAAPFIYTLF